MEVGAKRRYQELNKYKIVTLNQLSEVVSSQTKPNKDRFEVLLKQAALPAAGGWRVSTVTSVFFNTLWEANLRPARVRCWVVV